MCKTKEQSIRRRYSPLQTNKNKQWRMRKWRGERGEQEGGNSVDDDNRVGTLSIYRRAYWKWRFCDEIYEKLENCRRKESSELVIAFNRAQLAIKHGSLPNIVFLFPMAVLCECLIPCEAWVAWPLNAWRSWRPPNGHCHPVCFNKSFLSYYYIYSKRPDRR